MSDALNAISTEITRLTVLMNDHKGSFRVFSDYCSRAEDMQKMLDALVELDDRLKLLEP